MNIWNATQCRDCGEAVSKSQAIAALSAPTEDAPPDVDEQGTSNMDASSNSVRPSLFSNAPKRRWNVFWIVLGIAIHVAGVHIGVFSIIKFLVEPDAQVKAAIEKTLEAAKDNNSLEQTSIIENASEPLKSKLNTIRGVLIFLLAVVPVLIGMSTGFFSRTILDGAASMGLSAVLIPLLNGAVEFAIIWGPINASLGALGAYLGVTLARRFRPTGASNDLT